MRGLCLVSIAVAVATATVLAGEEVYIWPMPKSVQSGKHHRTLYILTKDFQLTTQGSNYSDGHGILKDGFSRFLQVIEMAHALNSSFVPSSSSALLKGIHVLISSQAAELQYGVDESYKLSIPDPVYGKQPYVLLEAQTVYGALHGLETFSQICYINFTSSVIEVRRIPWTIVDQPRFTFRGLLIDTSRHYLPMAVIKKVIDSMSYAKLNVLHWHIVDSQSFPLEIPSYPNMWNGAYSVSERYTMEDASEIVSYAQRRGINVMAEIDVPGHARSWGSGYPFLWPSKSCQEPLDVSNELTFKLIEGVLSDFSKVFKFKFVHLGGDEVNTRDDGLIVAAKADSGCWTLTSHVDKWLKKHGLSESEAYQYFVLRTQKIALSYGYEVVNWEETFNNFGNMLSRKTVVHNWLGGGVAGRVVASGLRCIVSNQDVWYLDHLDTPWQDFYLNEPLVNITNPEQQKLVIGGEVCMWGEHIDGSDIEQTIWPRAAAAAERLWTHNEKLAEDPRQVTVRLAHFRCLLNQRGVAAAPLAGPGRGAPQEPSSCYLQ